MMAIVLALVVALVAPGAQPSRVDTLGQLQALNLRLLASRSATLTLEDWCRDHHLADDPRIVADRIAGAPKAATAEQRKRLEAGDREEIRFRHVRLRCGTRVLSEADNWYLPGRLTPDMNRLLDATDTPFGKAVAALQPTRETFGVRWLWADTAAAVPAAVFEHRAVLYTADHRPFSEVDEVYQRALIP